MCGESCNSMFPLFFPLICLSLYRQHTVFALSLTSMRYKVLLLLDNHYSHLAIEVMCNVIGNVIVLFSSPPHCSHKLQPVDRTVYGPLKQLIEPIQVAWMRNNPGKTMTIYGLPGIIRHSWPRASVPLNVTSGFAVTGTYPFDRNIFSDEDLPLLMSQTSQTLKWV